MKKVLFSLLLTLFAVVAFAQSTEVILRDESGAAIDTVTNTTTGYLQARILAPVQAVGIQAVLTKLSGTTGGSVKVFGSIDGVNFAQISSDTLAAANVASQTKIFKIEQPAFTFFRVVYTGAGTHSTTISAKALVIKK